jgi:hypothetical protein
VLYACIYIAYINIYKYGWWDWYRNLGLGSGLVLFFVKLIHQKRSLKTFLTIAMLHDQVQWDPNMAEPPVRNKESWKTL